MPFIFEGFDRKPDGPSIRQANRDAHLAYLERYEKQVLFAGPILDEDREAMIGSLLILDLPDEAAMDAFLAEEPYRQAGLFEAVAIHPTRQVFPRTGS